MSTLRHSIPRAWHRPFTSAGYISMNVGEIQGRGGNAACLVSRGQEEVQDAGVLVAEKVLAKLLALLIKLRMPHM